MTELAGTPSHVPPELVVDFDLYQGFEVATEPYIGLSKLFDGPDIFFTPRNGGHWVIVRAKDARDVLSDDERFSADSNAFRSVHVQGSPGAEDIKMVPAQIDAPEQFEMQPGAKIETSGGLIFQPKKHMDIRWDVAKSRSVYEDRSEVQPRKAA